jgi:hypothetical protein
MAKYLTPEEYDRLEPLLLQNMKQQATPLRELLDRVSGHWGYEDGIYRFYHESFKVFILRDHTKQIVAALAGIAPEGRAFGNLFAEILAADAGREFTMEDNQHWIERTAPIVQAFLHAKYFLEMAVKYAAELDEPPETMPSGWAALLCLYGLR